MKLLIQCFLLGIVGVFLALLADFYIVAIFIITINIVAPICFKLTEIHKTLNQIKDDNK